MTINSTTGVISGTPTSASAWGDYLVTASNATGSTTAHFAFGVSSVPNGYAIGKYSFTVGNYASGTSRPNFVAGAPVTWSVSPALPAGLALGSDGSISGTPTAASAATAYTVTARAAPTTTISGNFALPPVTITVEPGPLVDLGHADNISVMRYDAQRVLSFDSARHWNLWDTAADTSVASGDAPCAFSLGSYWCVIPSAGNPNPGPPSPTADLAGPVFVMQVTAGLEVRSSSDGHLLGTKIPQVSWWRLASDGSYIVVGNSTALTVWSTTDLTVMFSRPGDYSQALAFAAPSEVRVAGGPAGQSIIEKISVPGNTSASTPAFQGQFLTWFFDGQNFLTKLANTVWTYSKDGTQLNLVALTSTNNLGGEGSWFWTYPDENSGGVLNLYAVGSNSASPAASYSGQHAAVASKGTIALPAGNGITVIDISGATPSKTDYPVPLGWQAFASVSSSHWFAGSYQGLVLDGSALPGQVHYLDYGLAYSIAASATRIAVSTAAGNILYFDASTGALQGQIPFASGKIQLSSDGNLLATMLDGQNTLSNNPDHSVSLYTLPAANPATPLETWTYPAGTTLPVDIALAASGTALGQTLVVDQFHATQQVNAVPGGAPLWSQNVSLPVTGSTPPFDRPIRLSPDGTLVAVSSDNLVDINAQTGTNIYKNGVLVTAVSGWATGWLDNTRLMTNVFQMADPNGGSHAVTACGLFDNTGHALSCPATLPQLRNLVPVSSDLIYSPERNAVFSVTSGAQTWASGNATRGIGAVAGSRIVFASDAHILWETY